MDIQHTGSPQAGKDYPRNWNEFLDWFGSEEACLDYLERLRWPVGFVCLSCGVGGEPYRSSRSRLMCRGCSHQSTVTPGTIFDTTRTPLRVWLPGAWYLTNQKHGVSALGLQRVLGLGSYETAWTMLHRFRRAVVRPDRERLKGVVEVDETYLSISDRDAPTPEDQRKRRKNWTHQVLVVLAVELLEPRGFGRIRPRRISDDSAEQLVPFVQASVEPDGKVKTDGSAAYRELEDLGYDHQGIVMLGSQTPAHVSMAGVYRVLPLISAGSWARTMARCSPPTWRLVVSQRQGLHQPRRGLLDTFGYARHVMLSFRKLVGAAVLAAPHLVSAQVVWWPGDVWGPWAPTGPVGAIVLPQAWAWASPWGRGAYQYELPPCYRIGRCTLDDVVRHLGQMDRLERLAPAAPAPPPVLTHETRRVEPTDPRQVQPAYAGSGEVRPQFAASGSVRE